MKLEYVRLINFRQFYREQIAEFSAYDDLNVTVFHGVNGAGKTSLFSAINWCLYEAAIDNIGLLINKKAWAEAEVGQIIPVCVTIGFIHKGYRYIAERVMQIKKADSLPKNIPAQFTLTRVKKSGDSEDIPNPIGVMNAVLPANVRPYFFFDGEKMDDLTRADNSEVQSAVRNIMRLPMLERSQAHLQEIADEYRREIKKKGSHELEELITREQEIRVSKEKLLKRREEVREEIRLGKLQLSDIETRLRGTEAAKELQKRRDSIQSVLKDLEESESETVLSIQKLANRSYIFLLEGISKNALGILDQKREKGEIPSGIREQFIRDLLERKICVCGKPFEEDDQAYQHLTSLLKKTSSGKLESEAARIAGHIRSLSATASFQAESLTQRSKELAKIRENYTRLYAELDDVKRQLAGIHIDEIADLERQRDRFQKKYEMNLAEQGRIESDLKRLESQLTDVLKERQAAEKKQKELAFLIRKESLAQRAADAVGMIKEEFFEQTRKAIESATKTVFGSLAWKQDHFQDVRLDPDFRLEVIDRWGTPTRKELSAGERQILSLSFITAMSKLSGEEAPLVMDTPFGRLSGNHLAAVAQNLPELTPQLILFVTDREWDEASKTRLEPRTGNQYILAFDQATGCTEIKEVCYE